LILKAGKQLTFSTPQNIINMLVKEVKMIIELILRASMMYGLLWCVEKAVDYFDYR
jgi:hypothetical protein